MKYIDEFRDAGAARALVACIGEEVQPGRSYRLMEFCGGHTHTIFRYGTPDVLPEGVTMVHGPGCPVCVLPIGRLDMAIALASKSNVILCTYGDMLRVPASGRDTLQKCKGRGHDVRMVYSAMDALALAEKHPGQEIVFFAIGFETTTPGTAVVIQRAKAAGIKNFSVLCNHVLTPSAVMTILEAPEVRELGSIPIDGFVGPGHVSSVIGTQPYEFFAEEYRKPVVIAGFELLDVLQAIRGLVRQINEGRAEVENEYSRAVTRDGNSRAKAVVADVMELRRTFEWRGLGSVPYSGLAIRAAYANFDAEIRFDLPNVTVPERTGCRCGAVLRGVAEPRDCPLFGTVCTPEDPVGSCMVSSEGSCSAVYMYGATR